jgi:hypothetical protein
MKCLDFRSIFRNVFVPNSDQYFLHKHRQYYELWLTVDRLHIHCNNILGYIIGLTDIVY